MPTAYRGIRDALLIANFALPNASATTFSPFIDLGSSVPYPTTEGIALAANVPLIANIPNAATITLSVEDADANANANAATLTLVGTKVITGGVAGAVAVRTIFSLPATTRRFVRLKAVAGAGAGTGQTEIGTAELCF